MFRRFFHKSVRRAVNPLVEEVERAVKAKYSPPKTTMGLTVAKVAIPALILVTGYVSFNTYQSKPAFFPLIYSNKVPFYRSEDHKIIDTDKLKQHSKEALLSKLSMNRTIRETLGLPLQLGDFDKFDVSIEYANKVFEGVELDFTKRWFPPEIRWTHKQVIPKFKDNLNGLLEPLTPDGALGLDSVENHYGGNVRDYNIIVSGVVEARCPLDGVSDEVDSGLAQIAFRGIIEFDHIKTIKTDKIVLSYRSNGRPVERSVDT
ncbi:hypothetical protein OGAPHI_005714 [Ogataea philodendri]|uniref:Uncharacterized protein n=1 Tax=Ogataea philodendri TaxID=1378263 RepID=A0A9P8NZK1_9ASCO|nr:uncharacterized protein OGAPHI_005714 [Ogataea philodendri]KAH3662462.1 hypothetical protein OGAPHI_005714 [Ogataea philodendri]